MRLKPRCERYRREWRHLGADVQQHVLKPAISGCYEVLVKHFETNLHAISAGVSLWMTVIGP